MILNDLTSAYPIRMAFIIIIKPITQLNLIIKLF